MKKMIMFSLFLFISVAFSSVSTIACEAMFEMSVEDTITGSDLIILGQKIAQGPYEDEIHPFPNEPSWVDIEVIEILKGDLQEKSPLRVQTNTVCGYGFPAPKDKKEYIMFFVWDSVSQAYVRVDHLGEYASQALISLEDISYTDFLLEHDLTAKQITDEEKENISKPYLAIFIFFVLICFVFCMKRRK